MSVYFGLIPFISIILIMILAALSLVSRYRSAGQLIRLQLRWFMFGGFIMIIFNFLPVFFIGSTQIEGGIDLLLTVIGFSAILPLYLGVGIAILRYRLFDIDLIIRKTLTYALLTGLLAIVYFGLITVLQGMFSTISRRPSEIILVISTLGMAALFSPLRQRIQALIDRYFYRSKYDADRVLAGFASTARDEVDQDSLTVALVGVVQETIQPENASLWLKSRSER
jgi:hypothetical protein